jgi:hypothetical protein
MLGTPSRLPDVNMAYSWRGIIPPPGWEGHMPATIGRRDLIAGLGGAAIAWPTTAPAQGVNREQAQP